MANDAPEFILAQMEPYDFPGYSPCWVWDTAEGAVETEGTVPYRRADLAAAEIARLTAELARARADALEEAAQVAKDGPALHRKSIVKDWTDGYVTACNYVAAAIRALAERDRP